MSFLNYELKLINRKSIDTKNIIDTLEIARQKYPGSQNSLNALCKRFGIDNSRRQKHSALVDCQLLKEVYINLLDQKEPKLNLETTEIFENKTKDSAMEDNSKIRKIIYPSTSEKELHKNYLRSDLSKNLFG